MIFVLANVIYIVYDRKNENHWSLLITRHSLLITRHSLLITRNTNTIQFITISYSEKL